ncbi:hypothetical protein PSYJA_07438 [Pseudomonas syringae pv. japonica str. M301072]|uniref:Uncharacterized protein n=1 Tax=Pseudomonas syringae pv. japonica str. M301072 TaxID=629262 RepID=F3FF19_PSESX|nr:hypothetical protein PSYJA_07438 [Pseudomonas syringae pv. japonica str. M301072]
MLATGFEASGKHLDIGLIELVDTLQPGTSQRRADSNAQGSTVSTVVGLDMHARPLTSRQPADQIRRQLPVRGAETKDITVLQSQAINRRSGG